ncbi:MULTISPECIES: LysR family transcriptional regulator [unclassified Treponema]|uniref:LysR family transcriptional regulator n=1 Tax=unclassified Treponema TaxID=2638727 RepID=UPI0025CC2BE4|nr:MULTISPECIES: LysR family transcriptional regulator [unclassified Treponema]
MYKYIAFLKVVETGSFTKAADIVGCTQPALSQMISSLENELSVQLLHRSRYGIKLTLDGEKLFPFIKDCVEHYKLMRRTCDEICGLETGLVRIGTVSSVSCHWLPEIIKLFWEKYPKVQLVLHQGDYSSIAEWVKNGSVDFGFVNPAAVSGMESKIVKTGEFCAVVPKNHPLSKKKSVTLKDLKNEPFLLLEEGAYSEILEAFRFEGISPDIKLRVHDDYSILSMVEKELGISILTKLVLNKTCYDVVSVPIEPPVRRTLAVVFKNYNLLPIAAKTFIDFIMERKSELL